jgi:hypothetical protein
MSAPANTEPAVLRMRSSRPSNADCNGVQKGANPSACGCNGVQTDASRALLGVWEREVSGAVREQAPGGFGSRL